jgi:hypothetical protein
VAAEPLVAKCAILTYSCLVTMVLAERLMVGSEFEALNT